jgi:tubulin polyglutamylase complex subunit 2
LTFSAALHDIRAWETANHPHRLPDDFKSFIQVSDGLLLRWKIRWQDRDQPLGCLHLNRLRDVVPVRLDHSHGHRHSGKHGHHNRDGDDDDNDSDEDSGDDDAATASVLSAKGARRFPAFDLDSTCAGGRVVFLYRGSGGGGGAGGGGGGGGGGGEGTSSSSLLSSSASGPQVWFQDMSSRLFFIAKTFTDYFRLMVMHLGIPCWQYAFTDVGLDPICRQWFRFLSPERLAIDTDKRGGGGGGGGGGGKGARMQPIFSHVRSTTATRPDAEAGIVSRDSRGEPKMGGCSGSGSGGGGGIIGQREDAHRWPISSLERKPLTRPSSAPATRRSAATSSGSATNTVAYSRTMRGFQRGGP